MVAERGDVYAIELALDRSGNSLVGAFLNKLAGGKGADRDRLADILVRLEKFAQKGILIVPRELNQLTDELWEIKAGTVRLPFYYRPGQPCGQVRLTHGFVKRSEKTPRREIDLGMAIMREDLKR
ncbi:type II toxin-antitoxin system RelE/ParE family toxin [Pimelobacter simplex]|uniref:type II toxin-antitoxin system RelE/ParE family toxin n=1 Tax=Nocardioides simplex TaxID=2045 RepID=UPI003AAF3536